MPRRQIKAYRDVQKETLSNREVEASILTQAALELKDCQKNWDTCDYSKLDSALKFNQYIWSIFQTEIIKEDNALPVELKRDILNLSIFIDKRIFEITAYPSPEKLTAIININLNIASGLRGSPD